jgi:hypothetical protein
MSEDIKPVNPLTGFPAFLPLNIYHVDTLRRLRSPFLAGQAASLDDLAIAIFTCTRSIDAFAAAQNSGSLQMTLALYKVHLTRINAGLADADFRAHLAQGVKVQTLVEFFEKAESHPENFVPPAKTRPLMPFPPRDSAFN